MADEKQNANLKEKKQINLKVVTPLKTVYDKPVDLVVARTVDGDIGVMHGHDPCMASLKDGILRVFTNLTEKQEDVYLVLGGVLSVTENGAVVSTYMAAPPNQLQGMIEQIDAERAANATVEHDEDLNVHRAETAMRRALVSMDVSAYSILKHHGHQTE